MSADGALSDPREFREAYEAHYGFVWHALHRFGLGGAVLEDALQDVFVVAYRRRGAFSGSMKAWLYSISRRVASNYRRSAQRADARAEAFAVVEGRARASVPEAILELDRMLEGLSAQERELFVLSEVEGMTGPEIAAAWGLNLNTVYTRIRKLRSTVRAATVTAAVQDEQPRTQPGAWAALMPALGPAPAVASSFGVLVVAAAVVTVGVAGVLVTRSTAADSEASPAFAAPVAPADAAKPAVSVSTPTAPTQAPEPAAAVRVIETSTSPPRRAATSAASHTSTLTQENVLLEAARSALRRGDAAAALEHTTTHATTFPDGALRDVRDVVRIEALCVLGKAPQARAEATLLLERRPGTTARRRLEKTCAGSPRNPASPDMTGA